MKNFKDFFDKEVKRILKQSESRELKSFSMADDIMDMIRRSTKATQKDINENNEKEKNKEPVIIDEKTGEIKK